MLQCMSNSSTNAPNPYRITQEREISLNIGEFKE